MTTQHSNTLNNSQTHHRKKQYAVLGIGNPILGDEGIGVHVIEHLRKKYRFSPEVALINGGCGGLNLFFILERYDTVIIVDALPPGTAPPGSTRIVENLFTGAISENCSAHSVGVKDTLLLLKHLSVPPKDIILIGAAPNEIKYGLELSPVTRRSLFQLEKIVIQQLRSRNIKVQNQ